MPTIYFAVGHGGGDPGAVAVHGGNTYKEFDVCTAVLDRAKVILKAQGVDVKYVPLNMSLPVRIKWANANIRNDQALIELHMNSASAAATGAEMFFYSGNAQSETLADMFLKTYCKSTGLRSRGVKPDTSTRFGRLGIIRDVRCRSTLLELGFISNKSDLEIVQAKASLGLANIVLAWFNLPFLTSFGEKETPQVVSQWAVPSVMKAKAKGVILDWSRPQDIAEAWWLAHVFHKLGGLDNADGPLTKERVAVALDRLKLL